MSMQSDGGMTEVPAGGGGRAVLNWLPDELFLTHLFHVICMKRRTLVALN